MTAAPSAVDVPPPASVGRRRPLIYYGYWILGAAFAAQFVHAAALVQVSGVFLGPMTDELDWTRAEFAYGQSLSRFVTAFVGFFIGAYVDRFGGRAMMVMGVTILGAGLMLSSTIDELWEWVVLRGVVSTAGGALMGSLVVNVTLSKWFVEKRGRVVGFATMGFSFAGITAPLVMTAFVDAFGWRAGWVALGLVTWLIAYPAALLLRRQPEDFGLHPDGKTEDEVRSGAGSSARADFANSLTRAQALRTPALYTVILSFGLAGLAGGSMLFVAIPFLTDAGFSRGTAALMMTTMSFPAMLSKPLWGWAIDALDPKKVAALMFVVISAGVIAIHADGPGRNFAAAARAGVLPVRLRRGGDGPDAGGDLGLLLRPPLPRVRA